MKQWKMTEMRRDLYQNHRKTTGGGYRRAFEARAWGIPAFFLRAVSNMFNGHES